jgi:hypothetical protein
MENVGWKCPSCGACYAPWVWKCSNCPVKQNINVNGTVDMCDGSCVDKTNGPCPLHKLRTSVVGIS